jgi:hypothetical protein
MASDRGAQHGVTRCQPPQTLAQIPVEPGHQRAQAVGRQPVGFRHDDVQPDRGRLAGGDRVEEPREDRARPWPLAVLFEAGVVDLDDHHGCRDLWPRREALVAVEDGATQ